MIFRNGLITITSLLLITASAVYSRGTVIKSLDELLVKIKAFNENGLYENSFLLLREYENERFGKSTEAERVLFCLNAASASWIIGRPKTAMEYAQKANLWSVSNDDAEMEERSRRIVNAIRLYNSGKNKRLQGDGLGSRDAFHKAIEESRFINGIEYEMKCLRQMSLSYLDEYQYEDFYHCNEDALRIARKLRSFRDEGYCLNNIGLYYYEKDNYSEALKHYLSSLEIAERTGNLRAKSECSTNIGVIYKTIGEYDTALEYFHSALEIDKVIDHKEFISIDLANICSVHRGKWIESNSDHDLQAAYDTLRECYEAYSPGTHDFIAARIANNLGALAIDLKNYEKGTQYYQEGLAAAGRNGDKVAICSITRNIGSALMLMGREEEALSFFREAIFLAEEIKAGRILWDAHLETADILKKEGFFSEALGHYQDAIDVIEQSRSTIDDEDLKTSFLRANRRLDVYHGAIDLLSLMHERNPDARHLEAVFQYMERSKARGFLDSLEVGRVSAARPGDPGIETRAAEIRARLSGLTRKLYYEPASAGQKAALDLELRSVEDEYQRLLREVRSRDPLYTSLRFPEILTLKSAQKRVLDRGTVVLTYAVGKESAYGLALREEGATLFRLPPVAALRDLVSRHLKSLTDREHPDPEAGRELFKAVLAPGLDRPFKRTVIVPDDFLHYLPFETLCPEGAASAAGIAGDVFYAPSVSSLAEIRKRAERRPRAKTEWLGIAASGGNVPDIPPLIFAEKEVEDVARFYPSGKRLVLKGDEAKEKTLKALRFGDYRVIHFAAHALIDEQKPVRSAVVLSSDPDSSEDGLLQAREIFDLRLNADLVVLSACRSAAGRLVRGEGLVGLSRSFLFAGASAVLVSLWPVDDEATGHLMGRFHFHLRRGRTAAAALRLAKADMAASSGFSHPYYWSGFVVSGSAGRRLYGNRRERLAAAGALAVLAAAAGIILTGRNRRRGRPTRPVDRKKNAGVRIVSEGKSAAREASSKTDGLWRGGGRKASP